MDYRKKQQQQEEAASASKSAKSTVSEENCKEIIAGIGRVEDTLKLIEVNGRSSEQEVRYEPRADGQKVRSQHKTILLCHFW